MNVDNRTAVTAVTPLCLLACEGISIWKAIPTIRRRTRQSTPTRRVGALVARSRRRYADELAPEKARKPNISGDLAALTIMALMLLALVGDAQASTPDSVPVREQDLNQRPGAGSTLTSRQRKSLVPISAQYVE
jgi:hypothetical protein